MLLQLRLLIVTPIWRMVNDVPEILMSNGRRRNSFLGRRLCGLMLLMYGGLIVRSDGLIAGLVLLFVLKLRYGLVILLRIWASYLRDVCIRLRLVLVVRLLGISLHLIIFAKMLNLLNR